MITDELADFAEVDAMAEAVFRAQEIAKSADDAKAEHYDRTRAWITANSPSDRTQLPGRGKLTVVRSEGRKGFNKDALKAHRPIDRDKLLAAITTGSVLEHLPILADGIEATLAELELDLDRFIRQGDPYAFLKPTKEK